MNKLYRLTKYGIKEREDELATLVAKRGPSAEAIKSARELGDLAENAAYPAARQEQERTETRISEVEHILRNAELINGSKGDSKERLGARVTLKSDGKKKEFKVVVSVEPDPLEGKISDESPLGQAVLGKKVGDEVEIVTPAETATYKVVEIS